MNPHDRYRASRQQLAQQFDRPTVEDNALTARGGILPMGTYADGRAGFAWPEMIVGPLRAYNALVENPQMLDTDKKHAAELAFEAAGGAMTGGLLAPRPRGSLGTSGRPVQETAPARSVDDLGYYSQALESAKGWNQGRGTPEQALMWLKKSGVKDTEIEATGLRAALDGRPSVTRDEIVNHLAKNRVGLREATYNSPNAPEWGSRNPPRPGSEADRLSSRFGDDGSRFSNRDGDEITEMARELAGRPSQENGLSVYTFRDGSRLLVTDGGWDVAGSPTRGKWSSYSLDPSNPTYRETVLHLPADDIAAAFRSGHFPEPNIVGHMMSSMNKHEGRPVYTIDQIQSDWGQKLRDGGVRDEGKIAELERLYREANARALAMEADRLPTLTTNGAEALTKQKFGDAATWANLSDEQRQEVAKLSAENATRNTELNRRMDTAGAGSDRLEAEWNTARNSAVGHPLVNTTDQWVNTTLRRGLRQAVDQNADYFAIPHGNTVLSYNPGDFHGMNAFYNQIVPKNFGNMVGKFDKSIRPQAVDQIETPSGMRGSGFTLFPITDPVRERVRQGLPLFSNPPQASAVGLMDQYRGQNGYDQAADQPVNRLRQQALSRPERPSQNPYAGYVSINDQINNVW